MKKELPKQLSKGEEELKRRAEVYARTIREGFADDKGLALLKLIGGMCAFTKTSIAQNPHSQEINVNATIYNEARRSIYLELRRYLPNEILIKAELN